MKRLLVFSVLLWLGIYPQAKAKQSVKLPIYALAKDAKFIGDYTGGAEVTVFHRGTGAILAKGITRGETGDTALIMNTNKSSSKITKEAAFYLANLAIGKATEVKIEVRAPLNYPQSQKTVSLTTWVYPDFPLRPMVIEIPGYIVEGEYQLGNDDILRLSAKVRMLCGCAFSLNGTWRSSDVYVWAELYKGDEKLASMSMEFVSDSRFAAAIHLGGQGQPQPDRVVFHARAKDGLHTGFWQAMLKSPVKNGI